VPGRFVVEPEVKMGIEESLLELLRGRRLVTRRGQHIGGLGLTAEESVDLHHWNAAVIANFQELCPRLLDAHKPGHAEIAPDGILDIIDIYFFVSLKLPLAVLKSA